MKKLFLNEKFLFIASFTAFLGGLFYSAVQLILWKEYSVFCIPLAILCLCMPAVYLASKKNNQNLMKGLLGVLVMGGMLSSVCAIGDIASFWDIFFAPLSAILSIALFINYMSLLRDSVKPSEVRANRIIWTSLSFIQIIWTMLWIPYCCNTIDMASQIVSALALPSIVMVIVCLEARLDLLKISPEESESYDNGYPEGYIFEYDDN